MCRRTGSSAFPVLTSHFPLSFSLFYSFYIVSIIANSFPFLPTTFLRQLVILKITGFPNLGSRVVVNTNILNSAISDGGLLGCDTNDPCRCLLRSRKKTLPLFSEYNVGGYQLFPRKFFLYLQSHIRLIWTFRRNLLHKSSELMCTHRLISMFQRNCSFNLRNIYTGRYQHFGATCFFNPRILDGNFSWSPEPSVNDT